MIGIYKITNPKGKIYIGQATDIKKRFVRYKRLDCKTQLRLYRSFLKYGVKNHIFEVVEECQVEFLNERERYWQDHYDVIGKKGLNCFLQETYEERRLFSKETKQKMSENNYIAKNKSENHPFFGKTHKNEVKERLSLINLGENNPMFGKKGKDNHSSKKVLNKDTEEIYFSISEAAEATGIKYNTLASYLSGRVKNKTNLILYKN